MRQWAITVVVLMGMMVSGWAQDKAQVEAYLAELQAANDTMNVIAAELGTLLDSLQDTLFEVDFDAEGAIVMMGQFQDRMRVCKAALEGAAVPAPASTLQKISLEQHDIAISTLDRAQTMIDIAHKMSLQSQRMKAAEPDARPPMLEKLEALEAEMDAVQAEVDVAASRGQALDLAVKSEKKKLRDEFGISKP